MVIMCLLDATKVVNALVINIFFSTIVTEQSLNEAFSKQGLPVVTLQVCTNYCHNAISFQGQQSHLTAVQVCLFLPPTFFFILVIPQILQVEMPQIHRIHICEGIFSFHSANSKRKPISTKLSSNIQKCHCVSHNCQHAIGFLFY